MYGPIPDNLYVLHHCDVKNCVNYCEHLFLGTAKDNFKDLLNKKLFIPPNRVGENNGGHLLTNSQVLTIREEYLGGINQCELGRKYGVSNSTIHMIVHKKTWSHL